VPKYFFQQTGGPTALDAEGFDLPDLTAARRMAVRTACAMIGQAVEDFCATGEWQMIVTDETGLTLFTLTFFASDAPAAKPIEIGLDPPRSNGV
jgi:hypothetical protein